MKIIVSIPKHEDEKRWLAAVKEINTQTKDCEGSEILGIGVWLIVSENALSILGAVISVAEGEKFPYRVLFVDSDTEWKRAF
jgi:hypothetical protein